MKAKKILIWSAGAILALAALGAAAWHFYAAAEYGGSSRSVRIPGGSSEQAVADSLAALGSFGSKAFTLWKLQGGNTALAHGYYRVDSGMRAIDLGRRLATGRQSPFRFTFNNVRTFGQLEAIMGSRFEADSTAFAAAADSVLGARGYATEEYAAAVLPDTYEFYWTASPTTVIARLADTRDAYWTESRTAAAQALGLSPAQVAVIASIVEEETAKTDERPAVARLYINRLNRGMRLQADPTVKFALGDFGLRRITAAHLAVESPFNTYANDGLPPGPIRIPDRATLDAVLTAPEHDYIYMCARPDFSGYHDFTTTYDRHRINAARYHRALSARGI